MDQAHAMEIVDLIRFQDEIRCLIADGDGAGGAESSFTALLGLAPHQAAELLAGGPPAMPPPPVKCEPEESDCGEDSGTAPPCRRPSGKRKEPERKVKSGGSKKSRSSEDEEGDNKGGDDGKLPYVHVRARRGQATDSHSLAERARREKINARMKLLQELVPGCSKISGTALVLDEIINHVQSLQRQVEFLSMKLAAVNPRIDFSGLDSFLAADNLRLAACNGGGSVGFEAPLWAEVPIDGEVRRHHHSQQQMLLADMASPQLPSSLYERTHHHQHQHHHHNAFDSTCPPSLFSFDSSTASVSLSANQLKMEAEF